MFTKQLNSVQSRKSNREGGFVGYFCDNNNLPRKEERMHYYEQGAHFSYEALIEKLEEYIASIETTSRVDSGNTVYPLDSDKGRIGLADKSRNFNLNNSKRQKELHLGNNQKKGITLILFNHNGSKNGTAHNIKPCLNNDPKRKCAISIIEPLPYQKPVITEKKAAKFSSSTSHPKKANANSTQCNQKPIKSNVKTGINLKKRPKDTSKALNTKPTTMCSHSNSLKGQSIARRKEKGNLNIPAYSNVSKQTALSLHSGNNQIKSIETKQIQSKILKENNPRRDITNFHNDQKSSHVDMNDHEDKKLHNCIGVDDVNKAELEPSTDLPIHSMTFANRKINQEHHHHPPIEKSAFINQNKEGKFSKINLKKQKEHLHPSYHQYQPNNQKAKHKGNDIKVNLSSLPSKPSNSINRTSSRNGNDSCSSKHSVITSISKPKEKVVLTDNNKVITTNTESASGVKVKASVTTTNHSPKDKIILSKKLDSYSKMKTKSNSLTSNCSKEKGRSAATRSTKPNALGNGWLTKKTHFVSFVQLNTMK